MDSVQSRAVSAAPSPRQSARQCARLAAALGVERHTLARVLAGAQHNLSQLRALTLADLRVLGVSLRDAERIFYLVQWERLQAHLERYGTLPQEDLRPLLETLTPIFDRHFSRSVCLNETLLSLYRAEFGTYQAVRSSPPTASPTRRFLHWLGFYL